MANFQFSIFNFQLRKGAGALLQCVMLCIVMTSPAITQGADSINLGWIAAMCLTPLLLIFSNCRFTVARIDIPAAAFATAVLLFPLFRHADTLRWSTQLYTLACSCWLMTVARLAKISPLKRDTLINILDGILAAYLLTLIIQQICVATGHPVFNAGNVYDDSPWKLNALMSEPSQTSWMLSILIFYRGLTLRRNNRRATGFGATSTLRTFAAWAAYLYVLFTTANASAYIWMPAALLPYLTRRNWAPLVGTIGCVLLIITVTTPFASNRQLQRCSRILIATVKGDTEAIAQADFSAATRIVPNFVGAHAIGLSAVDDWFGHGTDADRSDLQPPTIYEKYGDAGIFHVWYNYGFIAALLLWWLLVAVVVDRREPLTLILLLLALIESAHCNGQMLATLLTLSIIASLDRK
jgi:hypothetical protein